MTDKILKALPDHDIHANSYGEFLQYDWSRQLLGVDRGVVRHVEQGVEAVQVGFKGGGEVAHVYVVGDLENVKFVFTQYIQMCKV